MKNFFIKYRILITILKCFVLIVSIVNVSSFYSHNLQPFNANISPDSSRFLIGKYIIQLMGLHIILEVLSVVNLFSYYATKYNSLNHLLGVISIILAVPLFYYFIDDFEYYSGDVSPFAFLMPLLYLVCGVFDFVIAGKKLNDQQD